MKKSYVAEIIGTAILVFFGCGSAVFAGDKIGFAGIAITFGLTIIAAAYGLGKYSGAHLNPAVTLGALVSKRIKASDALGYIISQCIGGTLGAYVVYALAEAIGGSHGMGENLYTAVGIKAGLIFEIFATFIFVLVILGATSKKVNGDFAGLSIGLTLAMIHLVGIPITGVSVNPARSLGPALFAGGNALNELWLFIVAPIIGGVLAGLLNFYYFQDGKAE
ncbi:MIP family channel protein [Clostridium hydrogeniformans]|uniref:MIP family channel protein n=1 Tax=Clostridium hydrogeniformans TaxID=349933 RepID=UPI000480D27C|nr:MIP family channel protein [Clostridium hydrogeniformans]